MASLSREGIEGVVLDAIRSANLARNAEEQLEVSPGRSPLWRGQCTQFAGPGEPLIDVEEGLRDAGVELSLNDEHAMSMSAQSVSQRAIAGRLHCLTHRIAVMSEPQRILVTVPAAALGWPWCSTCWSAVAKSQAAAASLRSLNIPGTCICRPM